MTEPQESLVSNRPPFISVLLILLFIVVIGFMATGSLVGAEVGSWFYEGDLTNELMKGELHEEAFYPLLIAQGTACLIGLIVIPLIYLTLSEHKPIKPFFSKPVNRIALFLIPLLGICFIVAIAPITEWNMNVQFPEFMQEVATWAREKENQLMEATKFMTNFDTPAKFAVAFLVIAILPGIGEEFVFRGLIQNELWRSTKSIHVAIWVSAILFSAMHIQFFGFFPRMILGAMFGYMYYWSGNLLIPMLAHLFHNGFTLTLIYLYQRGAIDLNVEGTEAPPVTFIIICVIAVFALLYFFKRQFAEPQQTS